MTSQSETVAEHNCAWLRCGRVCLEPQAMRLWLQDCSINCNLHTHIMDLSNTTSQFLVPLSPQSCLLFYLSYLSPLVACRLLPITETFGSTLN